MGELLSLLWRVAFGKLFPWLESSGCSSSLWSEVVSSISSLLWVVRRCLCSRLESIGEETWEEGVCRSSSSFFLFVVNENFGAAANCWDDVWGVSCCDGC